MVVSVAQTQIIWSATVNITPASIGLAVVGGVRNLHFPPTLENFGHQIFLVARWPSVLARGPAGPAACGILIP